MVNLEDIEVVYQEVIPTRKHPNIKDEPIIYRYFLNPLKSKVLSMQVDEKEYVVRHVMHVNTREKGVYIFSSGKNKRIILKKRDPEKPSKFKWKLKLEIDPFDKLNNSDSKNDLLIKKPKKIKSNSSFENKEHKQQEKKTDYLREIVTKREQKKSMSNRNIFLTPKNSKQKWEKVEEKRKKKKEKKNKNY